VKSKLEVHEHCYITGPNARWAGDRSKLVHSHEGGNKPNEHADETQRTGPGCYTIDKDEWFARTGMRGGGRKKFTNQPSGVQLPIVEIDPPQIRIFIHGDGGAEAARGCTGPGLALVDRMELAVKAKVVSVEHIPSGSDRRRRAS
jgi:hypothetical protein